MAPAVFIKKKTGEIRLCVDYTCYLGSLPQACNIVINVQEVVCCVIDNDVMYYGIESQCVRSLVGFKFSSHYW